MQGLKIFLIIHSICRLLLHDDPFGEYFDSGLIWGPVHGRKIYAGFRFLLTRDVE